MLDRGLLDCYHLRTRSASPVDAAEDWRSSPMVKRIIVLAAALVMMAASPALAQQSPPTSGTIQGSVSDNGTITGNADGFQPGTNVQWTLASTPTLLGNTTADSAGHASITAPLPVGITAGTHTLTA